MSLVIPLDPALPVIAYAEASLALASIPMVYKFSGVFPEDLPGLPPDRTWSFPLS